jgi:hypothetical protein
MRATEPEVDLLVFDEPVRDSSLLAALFLARVARAHSLLHYELIVPLSSFLFLPSKNRPRPSMPTPSLKYLIPSPRFLGAQMEKD